MIGAIIGDTVGSIFEHDNIKTKDFHLFSKNSKLTDDSIMTLAVGEIIMDRNYHDKDIIIDTLKKWGRAYPDRGYGCHFYEWLMSDERSSYNSLGNGAAMRVSPAGDFGLTASQVKEMSYAVTSVTHSHEEGLLGAEVVALSIYYARIGKSKEFIEKYVSSYYDIDLDYDELVKNYQYDVTSKGTVPVAVFCFLISEDFEDAIRTAISIGGDSDTIASITGAIAEAYYKEIPKYMIDEIIKRLPEPKDGCDPRKIIDRYIDSKDYLKELYQ